MKKIVLILLAFSFLTAYNTIDQSPNDHLKTFAKAYGYVKYFHPSNEAADLDWKKFSALGAARISECKSKSEVVTTLNDLFQPIGPGIVFSETEQEYDWAKMTPSNTIDYFPTYWQHRGVSIGMNNQEGVYQSVRINQEKEIKLGASFGNIMASIDPTSILGKEVKYSAWVKLKEGSEGTGHLWFREDKSDRTRGIFDNMDASPVTSGEWQKYEIKGTLSNLTSNFIIGCFLKGEGALYIDGVELQYNDSGKWIDIPILNGDFEAKTIGNSNKESIWNARGDGYAYELSKTENKVGKQSVIIEYRPTTKKVKGDLVFEHQVEFGEIIEKEITDGIYCYIPLNLYSTKENTYPKSMNIAELEAHIKKVEVNPANLSTRLGNVINVYNVFQHFYPYFDQVEVDWARELDKALGRCYTDKTNKDHLTTLRKMTAPLRDGHIFVSGPGMERNMPAITWDWIEDKLVITSVKDEKLSLKVGDIVSQINGKSAESFFEEEKSKISGGTDGNVNFRAKSASLLGAEGSDMTITVDGIDMVLTRNQGYSRSSDIKIQENKHTVLDDNIHYLNMSAIKMEEIRELLPQLEQAQGIICDLRGYPTDNSEFITHLLKEKDTSDKWMRVPKIAYPDQENLIGYEHHGWGLEPQSPHLGDKKIVFLTDGRAISYAESYMGFIEGYDLATIVGQPTAGTNGNINPFEILGGYGLSWTGMKVFKHDGSQHHGIGILPDIYVEKTIDGLMTGRDEFLEKAIEVING